MGISPEDFAKEVAPCLALVAGSGMGRDDRRAWMNAAYKAVGCVEGHELARAAVVAMQNADHPSKIVPAIVKAIREERDIAIERNKRFAVYMDVPPDRDRSIAARTEDKRLSWDG